MTAPVGRLGLGLAVCSDGVGAGFVRSAVALVPTRSSRARVPGIKYLYVFMPNLAGMDP